MRLRNLYELAVAPGERKGFSLRLKKLEDLQMKIAEMQNTISNLKGTSVPDVLKKQMDDLINAASMEKEKLYSEIESAEGRNKSANGIPGNVLKLLKGIEKNSPTIMNAYRNTGKFLYRGIKSSDDALYGKPFDARRPKDSNADLNTILNKGLAAAGFAARRDNTSFTSGTYSQASNYGTVYIFFPRDGFHFHYSKSIKDLVLDSGKMNLLLDNELVEKVRSILATNWQEVDHYFSSAYSSSEFLSAYSYQSDIKGLQKAVADGKLPADLGKFQTIDDFVDPAKLVSQMEYDQSDLDGAINSGHEVMVTGPYYALRADKFEDHVKAYISNPPKGSVDLTPDTPTEAGALDAKINSILGQKSDGFLIGDWVQHKHEPSLKGEVVNNFYTNDFLLIKTYEGKLELVKNSNASKIDTPTIPTYKIDDKLYIRSKGTKYSKFNNKYGKVLSIDGEMVTITYDGYSNATVPLMLTEPAPKYDSEHPSVGDTVHINDGDHKGAYGVITYVSSYGDADVEIDGETETVSKKTFTVIDPATKPADDASTLDFQVGDFVEITGDSNVSWATFVGKIVKTGKSISKVQIMSAGEGYGIPNEAKISNNHISKITEEEFNTRAFKYGDIVTITGGNNSPGKTGKVTYFYSTGTIEVALNGGGYADVKLSNLNLASKLSPTDINDPNINENDKVEILNGLYKGVVGTVVVAGETGYISVQLINNTVNELRSNLKKVKSDTPVESDGVKVGDTVKVIDGDSAGSTGTIVKLGKSGTYYKPDDGSSEKEYQLNTSLEKVVDTNIAENDTVRITAGLFKGSVGIVKSFGDYGFVRITLDDKTVNIPDDALEKVKSNTPIKSTAELGDKVTIVSGHYDGKTGTIKNFGSTTAFVDIGEGSVHIIYTNLDKVNIPDDDLIDLDDIDFETFDEPSKPAGSSNNITTDFKQGDKIKLKSGPNKGKTGEIHYMWMSLPVVDLLFDDGSAQSEVPYADIEAIEKQIKFKKGDIVNIKDGALYAGQNGKIRMIYPDHAQAQVKFGNGQKAMYDFDSLELMSSSTEDEGKFKVGDTLKVKTGNFKDFEGTVSDIEKSDTGAYTYTIIINMFGKDLPFPFLQAELEKTTSERPKKEANKEFDKKAALKDLIKKGKASGQVSYAELNNVFPAGEVDAEQVADLMDMLSEMGIDIVDNTGLNQPSNETPEQLLATVTQPERKQGLIDIFKDPTAKLLIKNAVEGKYLSTDIGVKIFNIVGYDKYLDFVKPYLDLKGVVYG